MASWPICAVCDSTYDDGHPLAAGVTCPACAALRDGLITEQEAGELRFRQRLAVAT